MATRLLDGLLVATALVGVGVLAWKALDAHSHTCDSCGAHWAHAGAFAVDDEAAHACPRCGRVQWWRDGVPAHVRAAHAALEGKAAA